ncbi:hypothetical protein Q9K02_04600 [Qipengyuania sp. G39]|uniref:Uncharacterized protein n=1 Tax=Qipengyuania profundimaris TaxID=3067652 RepID=A0ABT9HMN4_9SPHN|nr:hypothetical protein [Qipengyuania sp. G39]MDP4574417.1 hypothetical protein [Qipengyuania sp. G39]
MNMITVQRPLEGEPLLPHPAYRTCRTLSRVAAFLSATGLSRDSVEMGCPSKEGFYADQEAGVVVTATSCGRPLFFAECEALAQFLQMDLVLMRFDPLLGASFDVLMAGSQNWLCDFVAWRRNGGDIWLVPKQASGPFFSLTKEGLDAYEAAPYSNGSERYAGIMRAIERPSFDGGF